MFEYTAFMTWQLIYSHLVRMTGAPRNEQCRRLHVFQYQKSQNFNGKKDKISIQIEFDQLIKIQINIGQRHNHCHNNHRINWRARPFPNLSNEFLWKYVDGNLMMTGNITVTIRYDHTAIAIKVKHIINVFLSNSLE